MLTNPNQEVTAGVNAQAETQETATATTATAEVKKGKKDSKAEAFKADGAKIRDAESDDVKAAEGTKSDKVAFVCALGDPNKKQPRVANKKDVDSYVVVGYKFKALEDMTVPVAPLKANFKNLIDVEAPTERQVKAGEFISLNLVETGLFISKNEFGGIFTGEGESVFITAKFSDERGDEPLPVLRKMNPGSIKENMDLVADMVGQTGESKGTPKVKPEYADIFGVLYQPRTAKRGTGTPKEKVQGESYKAMAAAFRQFYGQKWN